MRSRMKTFLIIAGCFTPVALAADRGAALDAQSALGVHQPGARIHVTDSGRVSRVYGAPMTQGVTPEQAAESFRTNFAAMFGVEPGQLVLGNDFNGNITQPVMFDADTDTYAFTLVYYRHEIDGVPVFRSQMNVLARNDADFPVVWVSNMLREVGDFRPPSAEAANLRFDLGQAMVVSAYPGMVNFSQPREVIYAGIEDDAATAPVHALEFIADNGAYATSDYQKRLIVTDAATGGILYDEDQIRHANIAGNVSGMATTGTAADACNPEASTPMMYARVSRGAVVAYADINGNYSIDDGGSSPVTLTSMVRGRYFQVLNAAGAEQTISQSASAPGPSDFVHNAANTVEEYRAEVNGYVQANVVRDYTLTYNPSYPTIVNQTEPNGSVFPVNVMVSGTCNAFYDGSSINFYPLGGGCNNTAFSVVIHHEYGHHLVQVSGSGQNQYGEGMGDVMGVLITDEAILAKGFNTGACSSGIRTANNTCQYQATGCSSCGSEIHACGQLISGCVWDTRKNLLITNPGTYRQIISNLAINAMLLHAGSSTIASDITVDYLTLDDDNGDLCDGTPHFNEIYNGFSVHNMVGGVGTPNPIKIVFPLGLPSLISPAGQTIQFQAVGVSGTPQTNTGKLYYRVGTAGAYTAVNATEISANLYEADLPATACGSVVQFYCSAKDTLNVEYFNPCTNPTTSPYSVLSGFALNTVFSDDFETNQGWTAGVAGDTATTGQWNRTNPEGTAAQPEDDHTAGAGVNCYVTNGAAGGSLGANDVDGGFTTLRSPVINLSSVANARVSYWRWYSNDTGGGPNADTFRVDITNNGSTWVNAETVGPSGAGTSGGWIYHEFMVAAYVAPTATVQVRFIAEDVATGSLIEAAVDDFTVEVIDCTSAPCDPCDVNCDGSVNPFDINDFLAAVGGATPCSPCAADTNGDGTVNPFDINDFLTCLNP